MSSRDLMTRDADVCAVLALMAGRFGRACEGVVMLIAMAGLPGAGKSSVAEALGRKLTAPVVSVDPIEAAMWRAGVAPSGA
jgi:adenylylsulfate kinase-like enzyme